MTRIPVWLWLAAAILTVGPKLMSIGISLAFGHEPTGEASSLGALPISLSFFAIVVLIEEPLWRGVALDCFGDAPAKGALVIGAFWAAWHVPLFAVDGTFQHDLGFLSLDFWVFLAAVIALAVPMTWLTVRSGGSILLAMVTHAMINLSGEYLPDDTTVRVLEMTSLWVSALILVTLMRHDHGKRNGSPAMPR